MERTVMKKSLFGILIFAAVLTLGFAAFGTVSMAAEKTISVGTYSEDSVFLVGIVDKDVSVASERPGKCNSGILGKIEKDSAVTILEQEGNWFRISADGLEGWIHSGCVKALNQIKVPGKMFSDVSRGSYSRRTAEDSSAAEDYAINEALAIEKGKDIIASAQNYLGKPYSYGAAGPNAFDCSGLLYVVFGENGMEVPRSSWEYMNIGTSVSMEDARAGDVICFSRGGSRVSHVGIYMGDGQFIHSATSSGVIITSVSDKYWATKIKDIRRIF